MSSVNSSVSYIALIKNVKTGEVLEELKFSLKDDRDRFVEGCKRFFDYFEDEDVQVVSQEKAA